LPSKGRPESAAGERHRDVLSWASVFQKKQTITVQNPGTLNHTNVDGTQNKGGAITEAVYLWMTQILCWGQTVRNDDTIGPTQRNLGKDSQTRKTHVRKHHISPRLYTIVYFCFELAHKRENSLYSANVLTSQHLSASPSAERRDWCHSYLLRPRSLHFFHERSGINMVKPEPRG
jgi:hypothetical protein